MLLRALWYYVYAIHQSIRPCGPWYSYTTDHTMCWKLTAYLTDVTRLSPLQSGESLVYFYVVDNFMRLHITISVHTMYVRLVMYSHVLSHCIFLQVLLLSLLFLPLVHIHPGKIFVCSRQSLFEVGCLQC